jgi:ubiquinone/menaquinone biosynthesis C-methylase UbiE
MTAAPTYTRPRDDNPEILDDRSLDSAVVRRSMRDVALSNALFGGTRAVLRELGGALTPATRTATLLDVGTGLGDIPAAARADARQRGVKLFTIGADLSQALVRESRKRLDAVVVADAGALPFRERQVDFVTCSQLLHHFAPKEATTILREMDRVARRRVIASDIRRSRLAAMGLWLASFMLRFHPVSRHDGVASVRRGFTAPELGALVTRAVGKTPRVRRHPGFRITASWTAGPTRSQQ